MEWAAELDELNRREATAADARRWDELAALQAQRQALIARLPRPLPASARPALERGLRSSLAAERALVAAMAETQGTLERLRRGRRVVGAYAAPARAGVERLA